MEAETRYAFGKNWKRFVAANLNDERRQHAKQCLLSFLGREDLQGKHFLDIGCGSGLSSLAAFSAGAERIVSFDYDVDSVETTRVLRKAEGNPSNWDVMQGSVLDEEFMQSLEPADIVYSWGVLHHTGAMWQAVENAAKRMKPDGYFFIALYTTQHDSDYWTWIKQKYNRVGWFRKRLMELHYLWKFQLIPDIRQGRNTWKIIREYPQKRGMAFMVDVRDWLGGYPFEHATVEEIENFCRDRLDLKLVNVKPGWSIAELLFRKSDQCGDTNPTAASS